MATYKVRVAYVSRDKELVWDEFKTTQKPVALRTYHRLKRGAERIQVLKGDKLLFEEKAEIIDASDWDGMRRFLA